MHARPLLPPIACVALLACAPMLTVPPGDPGSGLGVTGALVNTDGAAGLAWYAHRTSTRELGAYGSVSGSYRSAGAFGRYYFLDRERIRVGVGGSVGSSLGIDLPILLRPGRVVSLYVDPNLAPIFDPGISVPAPELMAMVPVGLRVTPGARFGMHAFVTVGVRDWESVLAAGAGAELRWGAPG